MTLVWFSIYFSGCFFSFCVSLSSFIPLKPSLALISHSILDSITSYMMVPPKYILPVQIFFPQLQIINVPCFLMPLCLHTFSSFCLDQFPPPVHWAKCHISFHQPQCLFPLYHFTTSPSGLSSLHFLRFESTLIKAIISLFTCLYLTSPGWQSGVEMGFNFYFYSSSTQDNA